MRNSSRPQARRARGVALLAISAAALLAALPALAEIGPYLGLEAGWSSNPKAPATVSVGGTSVHGPLSFSSGLVGGGTVGYALPGHLRPELEVNYRRNSISDTGIGVSAITMMGNVWYDFEANHSYFYLGGGVGDLHLKLSGGDHSDSNDTFGGQLGGGAGFFASPQLSIGVDYRYAMGFARSAFHDSGEDLRLRYRSQTVMLGFRYSFGAVWNPLTVAPPPPAPVRVVPVQRGG